MLINTVTVEAIQPGQESEQGSSLLYKIAHVSSLNI